MKNLTAVAGLALMVFAGETAASSGDLTQSITATQLGFHPNVRAAFLRASSEDRAKQPIIDSGHGNIVPLDWLGAREGHTLCFDSFLGGYQLKKNGAVKQRLAAVFSRTKVVRKKAELRRRVPGAIDTAAPELRTPRALPGNLKTNIPEDFLVNEGTCIEVPPGANYLIYSVIARRYGRVRETPEDFVVVIRNASANATTTTTTTTSTSVSTSSTSSTSVTLVTIPIEPENEAPRAVDDSFCRLVKSEVRERVVKIRRNDTDDSTPFNELRVTILPTDFRFIKLLPHEVFGWNVPVVKRLKRPQPMRGDVETFSYYVTDAEGVRSNTATATIRFAKKCD